MDEKQKMAIALAVVIAIAAGLLFLIYKERSLAVATQAKIDKCRKDIKACEAKIAEIPALEAERNRLTAVVEEYVRILPDEKEVEALLETLSELKDQSGLAPDAIESFTFVPEPASSTRGGTSANFQKYIRQVRLRATLFQFATFVNLLERYKRFIQVDNFNIPGGDTREHDISMQMSTFTYTRAKKR